MALASIRPQTAAVSITIGATEHDTVLDTVSIRSDAPEIDEIVFANENTSGEQSVGTERFTLGFGGPLKKGAPEAVPFLPLSLYQAKAFDIDFDTDCNISGICNFISAGPDMRAGGARRSAATARNTGTVVVSWAVA